MVLVLRFGEGLVLVLRFFKVLDLILSGSPSDDQRDPMSSREGWGEKVHSETADKMECG